MVVPVLFHAAPHRSRFAVLYDGRIYHCHGWRVATAASSSQGDFHRHRVCDKLFRRNSLHHPGRDVHVPNPRLVRRQRFLSALPYLFRMHFHLVVLRHSEILWRHQGHDWILPNGLVEVLLGFHNALHLLCEFIRFRIIKFFLLPSLTRASSSSILCNLRQWNTWITSSRGGLMRSVGLPLSRQCCAYPGMLFGFGRRLRETPLM